MSGRIIEELYSDGSAKYIVEKKSKLFGWHTATIYNAKTDTFSEAVFDSLEDARDFLGVKLVSSKVIEEY